MAGKLTLAAGIRFIPASEVRVDALAGFFAALRESGADDYFHPHPLDEKYAYFLSGYRGKDFYAAMIRNGHVAGYGMLRGWDDGYRVPSLAMAVHPAFRGLGLGARFLGYLHSQARARGADRVRLKVYPENKAALYLYQSAGYRFAGKEDGQLVGTLALSAPMVYVSSSCVRAENISDAVEAITAHGIRHIELSGGTRYYPGIEDDIEVLQGKYGLTFMVHNYFPPVDDNFVLNIASGDQGVREKSLSFVSNSIRAASRLNAAFYTVHAGYLRDLVLDDTAEHFMPAGKKSADASTGLQALESSVRLLCEKARAYGLMFGVENLFPLPGENFSLLCVESEIDWLFKRCADIDNFGLLLDLGHARISSTLLGFDLGAFLDALVEKYGRKILGLHLSENAGHNDEHLLPARDSWMIDFIRNHGLQRVPVTIEARNCPLGSISQYRRYLVEALGENNEQKNRY